MPKSVCHWRMGGGGGGGGASAGGALPLRRGGVGAAITRGL